MLRKRQIFYLDTDAAGMYRVYEGRIVQARVIAVAEKAVSYTHLDVYKRQS